MLGLTKSSFSHEDCTLGYHQKKNREVSKYYENDYLQRFLLLFMSLLMAKLVKKSCISTRTHFIFRRNVLKQTWNFFSTKFGSLWIYWQNSYKVRQIFVIFSHLIAPIFGCQRNQVSRILGQVQFNSRFPESISYKICETNSSFHLKQHTTGKV